MSPSICCFSTIEFRIFRGTLEWESLKGAIELVDLIVNWSKDYGVSLQRTTEIDFLAWVNEHGKKHKMAQLYVKKAYDRKVKGE